MQSVIESDRLENESAKAYEAYSIYRDMGANRSQEAVGARLSKSRQLMGRWSAQHSWQERVRTHETYTSQIQSASVTASLASQATDYASKHLAAYGDLVELMRAQVKQYMESGDQVRMRDVIAGLDVGIKGQRLIKGESTASTEHVVRALPDSELVARARAILQASSEVAPVLDVVDVEFSIDDAECMP